MRKPVASGAGIFSNFRMIHPFYFLNGVVYDDSSNKEYCRYAPDGAHQSRIYFSPRHGGLFHISLPRISSFMIAFKVKKVNEKRRPESSSRRRVVIGSFDLHSNREMSV